MSQFVHASRDDILPLREEVSVMHDEMRAIGTLLRERRVRRRADDDGADADDESEFEAPSRRRKKYTFPERRDESDTVLEVRPPMNQATVLNSHAYRSAIGRCAYTCTFTHEPR